MLLIKEDLYDHIIYDPPDPVTNDWTKKDKKKLSRLIQQIIYPANYAEKILQHKIR